MDLEKILILSEIEDYQNQLKHFAYPYISNVNEINNFLKNNSALYKRTINYCIKEFNDGKGKLNPLTYADLSGKYKKEIDFIDKYKSMMKIIDLNKFETFFLEELEEYNKISNSLKDVQKWLDKVEFFFEDSNLLGIEYHTHNLLYLPENHLQIYFWDDIHIFLTRSEFEGAIQIAKLFFDLLWEQKVHPENRFYKEFNN